MSLVLSLPIRSDVVVVDSSSTPAVANGIVGAPCIEDGINSGSSLSSSRSMNPGNMEIDDVLLDYCTLNVDSAIRGNEATASCKFCDFPIRNQTSFLDHLRRVHGDLNIKPYECDDCHYKGSSKNHLQQHIQRSHAVSRKFSCAICGKGFLHKCKFNLHLKSHENKREYECDECDHAFNNQQDLTRHKKNVHFPEETAVNCPNCGRSFKSQRHLDMHMHVHTGVKEYNCEVCNKNYSTPESLRTHMKGHQYNFGCVICAKPLGSYSAFIFHKKLHDSDRKSYDCDECSKSFPYSTALKRHKLNAHSTERAFKCDQCPKDFKRKDQLKRHRICHQMDTPYSCDVCGHSVKTLARLHHHMYSHTSMKPYRCGICDKEYMQKESLDYHLSTKHAGVNTVYVTASGKGAGEVDKQLCC